MDKKTIEDKFPVHLGNAVLQYSKLHFTRFVYFIWKHLVPGSFRLVYCDTDSIAFATTKTAVPTDDTPRARMAAVLYPLVRPEMMSSFESEWESWFVLSNTTYEKRYPGKLKCKFKYNIKYTKYILAEFSFQKGEYIALTCKSYLADNHETGQGKRSSKGIPHRVNLKMDEYRTALYSGGQSRHMVELRTLRLSRQNKMARYTIIKKGISDLFYKMRVADDHITCAPLKYKNQYL